MEERKILKRKRRAQSDNNKSLLLCACADLAELYLNQGQYQNAIQEYETIAEIHHVDGKSIEYAKAHRAIGEAYMSLHNFEKALEHQKIYLDISMKENDILEQQRAYATMGHMYLSHFLETQMDRDINLNLAFKYFMKSLKIAERLTGINKLEKADMLARLFSNLGLVKESLGDYSKASELLNRSIAICKQHDIYEQLTRGYTSMASLYDKRGDFNETIHHYNLAIDAAKKLKGNVDLMCGALLAKSEVLIKLTDFHGAKHILLKAHKLKTPNVDERKAIERTLRTVATMCHIEDKLVVTCEDAKEKKKLYEKMGDCACALKNFTKAIEYYKLMLKYAEKCGIGGKELGSCYYSLAETYKDNNQFSEAEEYFEREYSLCENLKDNLNTLSRIADTKEAAGAPVEDVKKVYERAFNNCRSSGNLKEERRMLTRMISYLRRVGSHSDAFESEKYLNSLEEPDDDESSSSGNESDQSDLKSEIGYDLDLDDITDNSEDSDFEQKSAAETSTSVGKRKHRNFVVKKNAKGESQLHVACINGKIPVVRHLLEQGHPVNVRDNSGWLPLHEACNHGFTEIVGMLLDKGAAINDRGGTQCEGITPIYDAANNGHVGIVKLLLDRGASAIVKTDNGDTPLNVLKTWHRKNPFAGEDLELYNGVVKRMSEAMEKVGEKVDEVDFSFVDSPEPVDIRAGEDRSDHGEMEVEAFDADEPHFSRFFENDVSNPRFDVSSFSRMPKNVRQPKQKFGNTAGKKPALIRQDHTLDDWLEDDIQASRLAKKRRTTLTDSSISSSYWSQEHRNSKSPRTSPLKRTSNEFVSLDGFVDDDNSVEEVLQPSRNERLSLSGSKQSTTKKTLRRFNSGSSTSSSRITQYLRRTPSFEDNSGGRHSTGNFVEPDSTTSQSSSQGSQTARSFEAAHISAAPPAGDVMLYVDVKIETKVFRVPVWMSQIQTKTIGWLAEEAAQKYARKECSKPSLELETTTGALLSDDDPLTLLFPFGATKAEPVVGRIIEMSLPSLIDRYKEACTHAKTATNATVVEAIEEMSIRLSLENKALTGTTLAPLCIALNHQSSLLELNLSANFLDLSCFTKLCSSLPTLVNLTILNLRCSGLSSSHLGEMVKVVSTASARVLEKLSDLDLSDNYLRDKSFRYLSELTNRLKLGRLNVSNVGLTKIDSSPLELRGLRSLDVSDNRLDTAGVAKVVSWTNPAVMSDLNVSRNERSNESVLASVIDHMKGSESIALEALNVSRCNLQENELYGLLRLCSGKSLKKLNLSYNQNLTGISLRRLLEFSALREINLIGCENIFQYFDGCEGCDLLQGNGDDTEKVLKLSANMSVHSSQIDVLTEAFKKMNSDLSVETGDVVIFKSSRKGGEALRNFL